MLKRQLVLGLCNNGITRERGETELSLFFGFSHPVIWTRRASIATEGAR